MTFNGLALADTVQVRDAETGTLLGQVPLDAPNWSGIAVVGDTLVLGTGASQQGSSDGVVAVAPHGLPLGQAHEVTRDPSRSAKLPG
jgi:hypothetical protein